MAEVRQALCAKAMGVGSNTVEWGGGLVSRHLSQGMTCLTRVHSHQHRGPLALFYERIFEAFVCGVWTRVRTATKKTVCRDSHTVGKPHTLLAMFVCKLSVRVANVTLLIHVKMVSRKVDISLCARSAVCFWLLLSSNC